LPQWLKVCDLLALQLSTDVGEVSHGFLWIQPLSTPQAHFRTDCHGGNVAATTEQFFYVFLDHLPAAHRTLDKGYLRHFFLSRHAIHRFGSGRYTVIRTAH